ncbi:MAG: host attachment protein [Gammaproteobacteria bacterium]|nr:host attachment protein [Gammaproteobacteria bacterium]MDH5735945.1 host attachment protein [Gammaproteobacteria bacterium]
MPKTWVVVAESSRAKIFELKKKNTPLKELKDFLHPSSRLHEQQISSDLPGNTHDNHGYAGHKMTAQTTIKEQESMSFAKTIGQHIEKARSKGEFQQLILMSPPAFLGQLRKQLSRQTFKRIISEIDKNLVRHTPHDIRAHLPYHF